jgi:hypothetical protein
MVDDGLMVSVFLSLVCLIGRRNERTPYGIKRPQKRPHKHTAKRAIAPRPPRPQATARPCPATKRMHPFAHLGDSMLNWSALDGGTPAAVHLLCLNPPAPPAFPAHREMGRLSLLPPSLMLLPESYLPPIQLMQSATTRVVITECFSIIIVRFVVLRVAC